MFSNIYIFRRREEISEYEDDERKRRSDVRQLILDRIQNQRSIMASNRKTQILMGPVDARR